MVRAIARASSFTGGLSDMSGAVSSTLGCPGCAVGGAAPLAFRRTDASHPSETVRHVLSLPDIHCGRCITSVERTLSAEPSVVAARVNLSLRRVFVDTRPGTRPTALIAALAAQGHAAAELDADILARDTDPVGRALLMRLGLAFFAAMNVMLLSVAVWSGASDATRDLFHWISAAISVPAVIFCGRPFFASALSALAAWRLNMDVPISLALILALALSLFETASGGAHAYFDSALTLTFFLLIGRYLEHRARSVARSAARELTALESVRAVRLVDDVETEVAAHELSSGDRIRVRPGLRLPADGVVAEGASEIDASVLTGEVRPVAARAGDRVTAGTLNLTGPLDIDVAAAGEDRTLSQLAELVAIAEAGRSAAGSLADRAASLYAPIVHLLALGTFIGWMVWGGDLRVAANAAIATLIITCPCALGLAVPAVITVASGRLFRKRFLIKTPTALERLAQVDTVVFDKTGTLTQGAPELLSTDLPKTVAALALALARGSAHPLARAIVKGLSGVAPAQVSHLQEVPGYGVSAEWQGQIVRLGRAEWVGARPGEGTETWLRIGTGDPTRFAFGDALRPGVAQAVAELKRRGLRVMLLSGDTAATVEALAGQLGIEEAYAAETPISKHTRIKGMADAGARVLMVGDGINDTGALSAAHVSLAPASAIDAARLSADIIYLGEDLRSLASALDEACGARSRILQNFAISATYNAIAIPAAVLGFATPLVAALAMSSSSIAVSLNALRRGR